MLIGEVSRRCGVSTRTLRHYDRAGLVTPTGRTAGGYRAYSAADMRRLFHVESLRTLGLSLTETKRALDEPEFFPADLVGDLIRHTRQRIAAEQALLTQLERVDVAAPVEWEDVLHIVAALRALESEFAAHRQQAILSQHGNASLPAEALAESALSENDPNVAGALHWSLARAAGRGLAALAVGLDSEEVDVRRRATAAIAAVHTPEATELLGGALHDPDATVRGRGALALGSRGNIQSIPALVEMVVEGRRDVEAAELLGLLSEVSPLTEDGVVGILREQLDNANDAPLRLRITQALAEIPGTAARETLGRLAQDGDRTIAVTASAILTTQNRGRKQHRQFGAGQ